MDISGNKIVANIKGQHQPEPMFLWLTEPSVLIIDVNIHFDTFYVSDDKSAACPTHERVMMHS